MNSHNTTFWRVVRPDEWPKTPFEMTYTSLLEIETCPRRWALRFANYPDIWDRKGYPERISLSGLSGSVVHLAIQTLTKEFADASCQSVQDALAVGVIAKLGGYSRILEDCIRQLTSQYIDNPRVEPTLDATRERLTSLIPEMRVQVQLIMRRIRFQPRRSTQPPKNLVSDLSEHVRTPLEFGTHSEVTLSVSMLNWMGRADLINLSNHNCEIVDFKTGQKVDQHALQIQIYALLWFRDTDRNPNARIADKLTLSYLDRDVDIVAPSEAELAGLECDLNKRTHLANEALNISIPEARPSFENCQFCYVRHLCDEYWSVQTQDKIANEATNEDSYTDAQLQMRKRHGPSSWDAVNEAGMKLEPGTQVLLRFSREFPNVQPGDRIRVLNAHVSDTGSPGKSPVILTLGRASEVFTVSPST